MSKEEEEDTSLAENVFTTLIFSILLIICVLSAQQQMQNMIEASDESTLLVDTVKTTNFDILLTGIEQNDLYKMGEIEGKGYLNVSDSLLKPVFPVEGMIMQSYNHRLMINLLARRSATSEPNFFRHVIFMVDSGSPYTFLSKTAMKALLPNAKSSSSCGLEEDVPSMMKVEIQGSHPIPCYLSPADKHFAEVNVLGVDFLHLIKGQLVFDWENMTFHLQ
jgi:hypothetical protein